MRRTTTEKTGRRSARMPQRDITGRCEGECRDRVHEGETERQSKIAKEPYSEPAPNSPEWTRRRDDPPGAWGGHI